MQGLVYMHDMGVAHRYASIRSLIFAAHRLEETALIGTSNWIRQICSQAAFTVLRYMEPDLKRAVHPLSRLFASKRVQYYFIDFGLSRRYDPIDVSPLEYPVIGDDKTVPESRDDPDTPRNPFHTDVYCVGNLIRVSFLEVCTLLRCNWPPAYARS